MAAGRLAGRFIDFGAKRFQTAFFTLSGLCYIVYPIEIAALMPMAFSLVFSGQRLFPKHIGLYFKEKQV